MEPETGSRDRGTGVRSKNSPGDIRHLDAGTIEKLASSATALVLFDGLCNLCDSLVEFLLRHDRKNRLRFATLQSEAAKRQMQRHQATPGRPDSLIVIESERVYQKSSAVLRIVRHLPAPWPLLSMLEIVPQKLRDWIYDWIAKHRYRWFGRRASCRRPPQNFQKKFIDFP